MGLNGRYFDATPGGAVTTGSVQKIICQKNGFSKKIRLLLSRHASPDKHIAEVGENLVSEKNFFSIFWKTKKLLYLDQF